MKYRLRPRPRATLVACCLLFATINAYAAGAASGSVAEPQRYLVRFEETALGRYNDVARASQGSQAKLIPQHRLANGRARLDVGSGEAIAYVDYVRGRQEQHLTDIAAAIGRVPAAVRTMQHALSAAILLLTPAEAGRLAAVPGVAAVDAERDVALTSDVGPTFTSAASVWWGTRAGEDSIFARSFENTTAYRGDGVVIGDIDTGYNSASPSFQATDLSGAKIANPLGKGHYLGQCGVPGISISGCNDKVIGVYDEIGLTLGTNGGGYTVEDQVGHGSHTASIAAGTLRMASLSGYTTTISGVAPHANLVIYRVCLPVGGCTSTAIVAAIDQAIADGVVDALNLSLGGTMVGSAWDDPISAAFLSATAAGIFVAGAGGNSATTPTPGQLLNDEPWITTVASSWHSGGALVNGARTGATADMLSATSMLGPAPFDTIKPDMQAPGMHILAAVATDGSAAGPGLVAMKDGTSMAAAHMTGAGALLLGLHPDWTPLEVK